MRVLVISETGLGKGYAQRCERDGHDVKQSKKISQDWIPDFVIYDQDYKEADEARRAGFKVLGPSRWTQALGDKEYSNQLLAALEWPTNGFNQGTNFYLTGWFNGASFISTYTSIVYRRFMSGGAGPDLNCTGVLTCLKNPSAQAKHLLLDPLERILKKVNYRGPIHIHAFVNGSQWCVKELSASLMHPLSFVLFEGAQLRASDILLDLFDETSKRIKTSCPWTAALQLSIPPYPHTYSNEYHTVDGVVQGNLKHLWLADVVEDNSVFASSGLIGYVTARGIDENECVRRMYRTVGNIHAKDMQYRNDVGRNVQSLLTSLKQGGWIE